MVTPRDASQPSRPGQVIGARIETLYTRNSSHLMMRRPGQVIGARIETFHFREYTFCRFVAPVR